MSLYAISSYAEIEFLWKNNRPETMSLEFKKVIDAEEVAKDVSSFANADGGIIIYGVEESKGRAVKSDGIVSGQNSERIQQIVTSSTAPGVPMTIETISNPRDVTKEFVVVKIPGSSFYIHQVTTTGKYYVRANTTTTPHFFNPVGLGENEIARRYESRFQNKLVAESFVNKIEKRIFRDLVYRNWHAGLVLSIVPHVRIPNAIRLTPQDFRSFLVNKDNVVIYDNMPTSPSVPSIDGRHTDFQAVNSFFIEIDKDRSIFYCRANKSDARIDIFEPIFMTGELLHLTDRLMKKTTHYGGMTFRLHLTGGLSNTTQLRGITLFQSESDFTLEHELPPAPFDMKAELSQIFEKYFEALHVDHSLKLYLDTIPRIESMWKEYDQKTSDDV
jgi:hypothetical protein